MNVPVVEFDPPAEGDILPATNLGQAGDSRLDQVSLALLRGISRKVLHKKRPGAYQAHISPKHVPEFGQLVQARSAQEGTEPIQALPVRQGTPLRILQIMHRAKFIDSKRFLTEARPRLPKPEWPAHKQQ